MCTPIPSKFDPESGQVKLHANLEPLKPLFGAYQGKGEGIFPTIKQFTYGEYVSLTPMGSKPILAYQQRTWKEENKDPLHAESGYWRFTGPIDARRVELVIAQPSGIAEICEGSYEMKDGYIVITTDSTGLAHTQTTGRPYVTSIRRIFRFALEAKENEPAMTYVMEMATETTTQRQTHLTATFQRIQTQT